MFIYTMFHHYINRKTKNPNLIKVHSLLINNFLWQLNPQSPKVTHVKSCWSSFCLFALLFVCHCAHYIYIKRKTLLWNIFKSMCKAAISCKISYLSLCMLVLFYIIYISFHHNMTLFIKLQHRYMQTCIHKWVHMLMYTYIYAAHTQIYHNL